MAADSTGNWTERTSFRKVHPLEKAANYDRIRFGKSRRMQRLNEQELEFARLAMALVGPEASVLDVPCGNGRFYSIFSGAKALVMVDYDPAMLKAVEATFGRGDNVRLMQGDITAMPFADASFDLVFSMRLLHHIGDDALRWKIVGELSRVSRRYVALSVYSKRSIRYIRRRLLGKRPSGYAVSLPQFISKAAEAGLVLLRKYPTVSLVEQQRMLLFEKV